MLFYGYFLVDILILSGCMQRPATTTAKRLAKLDDVAFVGSRIIFYYYLN
jgi:hypothetical protein